jgi:hypothetical protein
MYVYWQLKKNKLKQKCLLKGRENNLGVRTNFYLRSALFSFYFSSVHFKGPTKIYLLLCDRMPFKGINFCEQKCLNK